jgi:hypothetical protein
MLSLLRLGLLLVWLVRLTEVLLVELLEKWLVLMPVINSHMLSVLEKELRDVVVPERLTSFTTSPTVRGKARNAEDAGRTVRHFTQLDMGRVKE